MDDQGVIIMTYKKKAEYCTKKISLKHNFVSLFGSASKKFVVNLNFFFTMIFFNNAPASVTRLQT